MDPPHKRKQLRSRALAYVRQIGRHRKLSTHQLASQCKGGLNRHDQKSFSRSGEARSPIRVIDRRSAVNSNGSRPAQLPSTQNFSDSDGPRPIVRVTSRSRFSVSGRSNSSRKRNVQGSSIHSGTSSSRGILVNTRSRRSNQSRKSSRLGHEDRIKNRKKFLAPPHGHGRHRFKSFCDCVKKAILERGERSSFQWGVGFEENKKRRLSSGARFRLELCGLHVTSCRKSSASALSIDWSSVDDSMIDSELGATCASPVACPLPLGLEPARQHSTTLQLRPRNGTNGSISTFSTESSAFANSSTGIKRKAPSSSSYSTPKAKSPSSPFINDFLPTDIVKSPRARSRVSVGCNGWFLADDDPSIAGWYRLRSSLETKPKAANLIQDNKSDVVPISPKRLKTASSIQEIHSEVSSPRLSLSSIFSRASSTPRSTAKFPDSQTSIFVLPRDGSVSSTYDKVDWNANSGLALEPSQSMENRRPSTLPNHLEAPQNPRSGRDGGPLWQLDVENETMEYDIPTRRRRSSSSSSDSSGGFGYGNLSPMDDKESLDLEDKPRPTGITSLTARVAGFASLRKTKSHSPRTFKRAFPSLPRRRKKRDRSQSVDSGGPSRHLFHLVSKTNSTKTAPPLRTSPAKPPRLSVIFIDCPP